MKIEHGLLLTILIIFNSCNQRNTKGETADSTQLGTDTVASKAVNPMETVIEPEPALVIPDSAANALNALVNSKFNSLSQDSSNYYKVEMKDYYDEYEGQDVMQKYTWYFDKEFSVVYIKYSYQNGAMFKPDVTEYIVRNNSIACTIETSFVHDDDKSITVWDIQNGGVKLNWSRSSEKVESVEPIAADYSKKNQNVLDVYLDALKSTLAEEETRTDVEVIHISIRKPKHAGLEDYKEVIIPKVMYDKLRQ